MMLVMMIVDCTSTLFRGRHVDAVLVCSAFIVDAGVLLVLGFGHCQRGLQPDPVRTAVVHRRPVAWSKSSHRVGGGGPPRCCGRSPRPGQTPDPARLFRSTAGALGRLRGDPAQPLPRRGTGLRRRSRRPRGVSAAWTLLCRRRRRGRNGSCRGETAQSVVQRHAIVEAKRVELMLNMLTTTVTHSASVQQINRSTSAAQRTVHQI